MHTLPLAAGAISLAPLFAWLGTSIGQVLSAGVSAAVSFLVIGLLSQYLRKVGINISDDQWAVVQRTAAHWAAQWWAREDSSLATATVSVGNPTVAAYAQLAINDIPKVANALGLTPDKMAQFVVAEIGKLQAHAVTVPVTPVQVAK